LDCSVPSNCKKDQYYLVLIYIVLIAVSPDFKQLLLSAKTHYLRLKEELEENR
jgi:hypothetical protein